jgi:hypothetical protein
MCMKEVMKSFFFIFRSALSVNGIWDQMIISALTINLLHLSKPHEVNHYNTKRPGLHFIVLLYLLTYLFSTTVRYYTGRLNQNRNRNRNRNRLHLSSIVSPISHPIISVSVIASHPISHPTLTNRIQSHLES